jgi:hypothetical protein
MTELLSAAPIVLAAGAAGAAQAGLLARSVQRAPSPVSALARAVLVALVLLTAARSGHLLVATAAWASGLGFAGVRFYRRLPPRRLS